MTERTGVWIIGAKGGVATTVVVGALAIRAGRSGVSGLMTETELCSGVELPGWDQLVFGGHDIRTESLHESALQIHRDTGTIPIDLIRELEGQLQDIEKQQRPGFLYRSGAAIEALSDGEPPALSAREVVTQAQRDLEEFRDSQGLTNIVVVNLSSTEPKLAAHPKHETAQGLQELIDADARDALIASTLYAVAAAQAGCAYINFTPSPGALLPGVAELFTKQGLPFMGSDGKTGETLVKSALAPMFRYRNLRVLSWQGYNMLGDRDGEVLASEENRATKVSSKDQLLHDYLGYPLHSQVSIDYVPSLKDMKTAWDFIHFEGFLEHKMSLQFTWQGCDAILAAPLVLDMVRLASLAQRHGESGALSHLAVFFKSPFEVTQHDLHGQFHALMSYLEKRSK